jgi:YesN/AraC family two-component response regulator
MLQEISLKLTDVAYESNYYDQSYFIKEYKKLTGTKPNAFFNSVRILTEEKVIWQLK